MSKYSPREQRQQQKWQEKQRQRQAEGLTGKNRKASKQPKVKVLEKKTKEVTVVSHPFTFEFGTPRRILSPEEKARLKKEREAKAQAALDRLYEMPGMEHIQVQVEEIIALKKVEKMRRAAGLKHESTSLHMAFLGNPGTGKTTVARLLGEAFVLMDMLKTDEDQVEPPFVQIVQSDVISGFVGGAEQNIRKKFNEAKGGVLFIDEAYALNGPYEWNKNMLAAIVSCAEDMREEVLCIVAGYNDEMQEFFDANPGMRSRFPTHITFPDYEVGVLLEIAELTAKDRDYVLNGSARTALITRFEGEKKLPSFGNARTVRNVMEAAIRKHSARMVGINAPTKETLMTITGIDIDTEVKVPVNAGKAKKPEHVAIMISQQLKDPWDKGKV